MKLNPASTVLSAAARPRVGSEPGMMTKPCALTWSLIYWASVGAQYIMKSSRIRRVGMYRHLARVVVAQ